MSSMSWMHTSIVVVNLAFVLLSLVQDGNSHPGFDAAVRPVVPRTLVPWWS